MSKQTPRNADENQYGIMLSVRGKTLVSEQRQIAAKVPEFSRISVVMYVSELFVEQKV